MRTLDPDPAVAVQMARCLPKGGAPLGSTYDLTVQLGGALSTVRLYLTYSATATQNSSTTNTLVNLNDIKLTADQVRTGGGFQ